MPEVLTVEALRRAVDVLKSGYRPAPADDLYAIYMRPAMATMLRRSQTWFRLARTRSDVRERNRRKERPGRPFTGTGVRRRHSVASRRLNTRD